MKKILFLLLSIATLCSCSSDDSSEPTFDVTLLEGGWAYDRVMVDGQWIDYPNNNDCFRKDSFGFRDSPTQPKHFVEQIWAPGDQCPNNSSVLTWKATGGNNIQLYFGSQPIVKMKVLELTENFIHFKLIADITGDGVPETQEFEGVPNPEFEAF